MTEPSKAVFLSYASEDAEAARRICEALSAAGIEVWFDQTELRGGDVWDRQIRKQIHDCALFIPIISADSQARLEGYFRLEWRLAVDRTHLMADTKPFLVPVVIDATSDKDAEVPDSFRAVQWTRLPAGETPPLFVERVSRLLSTENVSRQVEGRTAAMRLSPARPSWTRRLPLLIAIVVAIGTGYIALDKFLLSKRLAAGVESAAPTAISAAAPNAIPEKSIAVLPFADMSEKKDQEYFADGMAEEILDLLVKIPELKVIGRTSSFSFKGKADDLRAIGKTLGAAYIVEGSVRRSGDHLRVTAQLIDTRDGAHRWSETYDRDVSDVLKLQGEIAGSLVRALQLEVANPLVFQSRSTIRNNEAYDIYLHGLHALDRSDQSGLEEAVADFRRSQEVDPSFVPAAEALAVALANLVSWDFVPSKPGWEQARAASAAALKLNPNSGLVHANLGCIYTDFDWDWSAAERELKIAVALAPNNPLVLDWWADERMAVGQWNEAAQILDAARAADPLNAEVYTERYFVYLRLGRLAEAEGAARQVLEVSPTYVWAHYYLGVALLTEGKTEAALTEMQREVPAGGQTAGLVMVYHALHRTKDADAALARLEAENAANMAMQIAETYAFRGQTDNAFRWLDRAYAQKDPSLYYIKGDPLLKTLMQDPRYTAFLRKMNLPE